jgi:hypothetical protein
MGVPEIVFELHVFLRGSKDLQGDGDGYCPMRIREQRLARQTSDIFRAYGTYVNSVSDSAVAFSPLTGAVEDAVFSPDFEHALDFIKICRLKDFSLSAVRMDSTGRSPQSSMANRKYGTGGIRQPDTGRLSIRNPENLCRIYTADRVMKTCRAIT